jgi:hypothetical protein
LSDDPWFLGGGAYRPKTEEAILPVEPISLDIPLAAADDRF